MSSSRPSTESPGHPGAGSAPSISQTREYSCVLCKKRKVRCDRKYPCSGCVEARVECIAGLRAPYRPRKRANLDIEKRTPVPSPDIHQHVSPSKDEAIDDIPPRRIIMVEDNGTPSFGQDLWTGLNDEFRDPRGLKDSMEQISQTTDSASPFSDPTTFIFAANTSDITLRQCYPPPVHAVFLWQVFLKNVNPLSKLIHAPQVESHVHAAGKDYDSITKPDVALLFAIYAAAMTSMKDEDCRSVMGEPKQVLLARYINATQRALAAAGLLKSLNLVVLQAFAIYLIAARQLYDPQAVWLLTGMAIRMGQRIKLHSERESLGNSVFEVEIRRRVWWQLLLIDSRSGQLCGVKSLTQPQVFDFPLPANLNDVDINPDMTKLPMIRIRPTEMIFCLLRYEFGKFLNTNGKKLNSPVFSLREKDQLIDELENYIESNFVRYCDPGVPLHLLATGGARSGTCKMRLLAHHPGQYPDKGVSLPQSERDFLFQTSLKMVEYDVLGQSAEAIANFSWHTNAYFQLDAFVFMMVELRSQKAGSLVDRAWDLVSDVYKYRPELIDDDINELNNAIGELVLSRWALHKAGVESEGREIPSVIMRLESRRIAKLDGELISSKSRTIAEREDEGDAVPNSKPDSTGLDELRNVDGGLFFEGTESNEPSAWDMMDWDYWNNLLDSNPIHQGGSYD